jgi:hypothetical protein
MSTLPQGAPEIPSPELTAQQAEFVRYLLTIPRGGLIAAMAYDLGCAETAARMSPRPAGKRRHLVPVS